MNISGDPLEYNSSSAESEIGSLPVNVRALNQRISLTTESVTDAVHSWSG